MSLRPWFFPPSLFPLVQNGKFLLFMFVHVHCFFFLWFNLFIRFFMLVIVIFSSEVSIWFISISSLSLLRLFSFVSSMFIVACGSILMLTLLQLCHVILMCVILVLVSATEQASDTAGGIGGAAWLLLGGSGGSSPGLLGICG